MRKSVRPAQPVSVDEAGAVRAPPSASRVAGREPISHSSSAVAAAPGSHDAAAGIAMNRAMADVALPPAGAAAAPTGLPVRELASTPASAPASPVAAQVAPAIISLATHTDGGNEIRISLHPLDLGQVEIRLVRGSDGSTSVTVAADRPQTLQELAQNAHHLHTALDAASVPSGGRTLDFVAASATTSDQSQNDAGGQGSRADQDPSGGASGDRGSSRDRAWLQDRQQVAGEGHRGSNIGTPASISPGRQWQFNGLNITA